MSFVSSLWFCCVVHALSLSPLPRLETLKLELCAEDFLGFLSALEHPAALPALKRLDLRITGPVGVYSVGSWRWSMLPLKLDTPGDVVMLPAWHMQRSGDTVDRAPLIQAMASRPTPEGSRLLRFSEVKIEFGSLVS